MYLQVEKYHVKYTSARGDTAREEHTFEPAGLEQGRIVLKFPSTPGYGGQVEGRIKYAGFDSWSPWIKSTGPLVGLTFIRIRIFGVAKRYSDQVLTGNPEHLATGLPQHSSVLQPGKCKTSWSGRTFKSTCKITLPPSTQ